MALSKLDYLQIKTDDKGLIRSITRKYRSKSGHKFYLKLTSKNKLLFPVPPESLTISSPFGVETINIAHKGEVTRPGFRGLRSFEFSSFFPAVYNPTFCVYKPSKKAKSLVTQLESYRGKRKPLQFVVPSLNITVKVLVEDLDVEYKGGQDGDIYFTVKMTEYKPLPSTKIAKKKKKATSAKKKSTKSAKTTGKKATRAKSSKSSVKKGQTHTVARNETLQKISKKYYGTTTQWRTIYDINRKKIGANPNAIYPGQKLVIRKK